MRVDILEQCFATTSSVESRDTSPEDDDGDDCEDRKSKDDASSTHNVFRIQGGLVDPEDGQNIADALQSPTCRIQRLLIRKATVSLVALERITTCLARHNQSVSHVDFSGCTFVASTEKTEPAVSATSSSTTVADGFPRRKESATRLPVPLKQRKEQPDCYNDVRNGDHDSNVTTRTSTMSMTTTAMRHLANLISSGNETLTSLSLCRVPLLSMDDVQILVSALVQDNFTITHVDLRENVRLLLLDDVHDVLIQLALALSRNQEVQRGKRQDQARRQEAQGSSQRSSDLAAQSLSSSQSVASSSTSSTTTTVSSRQRRRSSSSRSLRRQECSKRWSEALKRSARGGGGGGGGNSSQSSGSSCCSSSSKGLGDAASVLSAASSAASSRGLVTGSSCHSLTVSSSRSSLVGTGSAAATATSSKSFVGTETGVVCKQPLDDGNRRRRHSHHQHLVSFRNLPPRRTTSDPKIAPCCKTTAEKGDVWGYSFQDVPKEDITTKIPQTLVDDDDDNRNNKGGQGAKHPGLSVERSSSSSSLSLQDIFRSSSSSPPPPTSSAPRTTSSSCSSLPSTPLRRNMGEEEKKTKTVKKTTKKDETEVFQNNKQDNSWRKEDVRLDHSNSDDNEEDDSSQASRLRSNSMTDSSLYSESDYTSNNSFQDSMTTASFDAFLEGGGEKMGDLWLDGNGSGGCGGTSPPLIVFDCAELKRVVSGEASAAPSIGNTGHHSAPPPPPLVPSTSQHGPSNGIHEVGVRGSNLLDLCPLTPPPLHPVLTSGFLHPNQHHHHHQHQLADDTLLDVGLPVMPSIASSSTPSTMTTCSSSTLTTAGPVSPTRILPPPPIVRKLSSTGTALGSIAEAQQEDDDESSSSSSCDPSTLTPIVFHDQFFTEHQQNDSSQRGPRSSSTKKKKKQQQQPQEQRGSNPKLLALLSSETIAQSTGSSGDVNSPAASGRLFHAPPPPPPLTRASSSSSTAAPVASTSHGVAAGTTVTSTTTTVSPSLSSKLSPKSPMGALTTTGSSGKRLARRCGRRKPPK